MRRVDSGGLFEDEPPRHDAVLAAQDDLEAQRRREAEAAAIQLARENAIAEHARRVAEERSRAEQAERDAELARLTLWTDSHCHLQYSGSRGDSGPSVSADAVDEAGEIIERACAAGVRRMVCVGTDAESSRLAIDAAHRYSRSGTLNVEVYATVGLHPHDAKTGVEEVAELLEEVVVGDGGRVVVAVGECGLDYHYDHSPRSAQQSVFAEQIALAHRHDLALVIHTRDAWDDTFSVLASEGVPERVIFHCFTGGAEEAKRCLEIGAYLSFSGIATFPSAADVRSAIQLCPTDRLLVETDSPYLTPVPHRGKTNEPSYIPIIGAAIAAEKGIDPFDVAKFTSANAVAAFGLTV